MKKELTIREVDTGRRHHVTIESTSDTDDVHITFGMSFSLTLDAATAKELAAAIEGTVAVQ